jgi:hypothetical protein
MNDRLPAQKKTSTTPPVANQACSPQLHQRPLTSEQSESVGSNSNISQELGGIKPKTTRRGLNWQNISVEAPSRSDGNSLPGGIQGQQQEPGAVSGEKVSADSAQKSALELSNSTISTEKPAQKPLIARSPFNGRNIPIEAPQSSSASSTYPGGIQRLETSGVKKQEESTESLQMQPQGAIQAKCSECEQQEKEEQNQESVQTKLTVGAPGDKYEQEADSMAGKVMAMPDEAIQQPIQRQTGEETEAVQMQPLVNSITPLVQRSSGEEEEVQMKSGLQRASDGSSVASGNVENQLAGSKGGGSALPDDVRSFMEPRFGADFSSVRVHTDSNALQMNKELGAQAFAHGSDIYYGAGKSPGKDELTAHELTHTVQQGGAVRAKQQTPSEVASSKTDSSSNEQTQTAATTADTQTSAESSKVESAETEHSSDNQGKQAEVLPNSPPAKENATKAGKPESAQGVEIVPQPGKSAGENGSEAKGEGETSPAAKAVEATKVQEKIQLPKEATAPGKEEKTKGKQGQENAKQPGKAESKALEKVPQAQALKEATAASEKANQKPEGNKEAANRETAAQKEKAVAEAQSATTELEATNAAVAELAGAGINFAPEQEEAGEGKETPVVALKADRPSGNSGLLEQQRAQASTMASSFLAEATGKVQAITGLGQSLPGRILASAENAKATVMAAVEQQKATVTAQIAQLRSQAQSEGQAALAQIQAQHQAAAAAIPQTTATARQQIDTEHTTALQTVDERVNSQITRIEELYNQANGKYRAAGNVVGSEAIAKGEARAKAYESQITGKDDSFLDGPLTDNKNKARANAAREVGKQYKQGLIDEANKQADKAQEGKSKDIEAIHQIAAKSRETLKTQHQATLDSLNSAETQALSQVQEAQTSLTEAANKTLQATLQSLDQQQASQLQLLTNYGQQQVASIDGNAQKVIASLQQGINRAGTSLQKALQTFQAQAQGIAAPDPAALSETLAQARAQIDGAIAQVQGQLEGNLATSEQGIARGGQQAIQNLSAIGQGGIQEAQAAGTSFTTTLAQLNQSATDTFNKLQETHQTTVKSTTETAVSGFKEVTKGFETTFNQANQNLEKGFENSVTQLQEGLRGALGKMDADIHTYAEEAASQVQPRWKEVLKILLIVAVIVVVAVVAGPAVIGAVGAMAGALGASAAVAGAVGAVVGGAIVGAASGAVIQMGSNLIDGKNIMEGVGQAALVGAIGGALGGAGGALGQGLGQAGKLGAGMSQSLGKFGIETAFDVTANILGDLVSGKPLTLEGIMEGATQGVAMSLGMNKFSKIKGVEARQTRFSDAGANFGSSFGGKINSGLGRGVDVPTGSRPDVDMPSVKPPAVDVKAPQTEVKAPGTDVKPPETTVKPPQTEVKAPEMDVKSPEMEVKAPQTEVKAPPTQVKPPQTEVKAPETQVKPPETNTPNGRTTHADEPEVEPGVVAKEKAADGHDIKVLKDGRVVRCSDCGEIRQRYADQLEQNPNLNDRLNEIEKIADPQEKVEKAKQLEQELAQKVKSEEPEVKAPDQKRKAEEIEESGESSTKKAKTEQEAVNDREVGSSGKGWDDPTMTEAEFIADYKQRFPNTTLSDDALKQSFQDGKRLNPETGRLATPVRPIEPTGTRQNLPTEGKKYEAWQAYLKGDTSKPPCFPAGTLVKTPEGDKAIETLAQGDLVFAYNFDGNSVVERPITAIHKNWTQFVVVVDTGEEKLASTRSHPYWIEGESKWLRAVELQKGMTLKLINGDLLTVNSVETYAAEEDTYNFEVEQLHNYFVNSSGVLVHNGDGNTSGFEKTDTFATDIYEVRDLNTGEVIYVGKSVQGVDTRFDHHLNDPKSAVYGYINNPNSKGYIPPDDPLRTAPDFPKNLIDTFLESKRAESGDWTRYETAVWEQHYIDKHGGLNGGKLINRINAITPEKFVLYSQGHNPCM